MLKRLSEMVIFFYWRKGETMATNGIWKIEKRLDHLLDYTTNIEKTLNSSYGMESYKELHNVIDYIEADYKTEKQCYVSGITAYHKLHTKK